MEKGVEISENHPVETPRSIYFNGFAIALGTGDATITLILNGKHVGQLNASYTVAKSLTEKLATVIKAFEDKTGHTLLTTDDVAKAIQGMRADKAEEKES